MVPCLSFTIIRGEGLKAMNRSFIRKTSDPYLIVRVGEEELRTKFIKGTLNPQVDGTFISLLSLFSGK